MLPDKLTFSHDGAQLFRWALTHDQLSLLEVVLSHLPRDHAGVRLRGVKGLAPFLASTGQIGRYAASVLGDGCDPVRAILFDKTPDTNWALGWHQDRTIAVKERVPVDGFGTWSVKSGMPHVEPPIELLSGMVTLRVHIDPVPASNAPLLIAPGSHKLGRIAEHDIREVIRRLRHRCVFGRTWRRLALCNTHSPCLGSCRHASTSPRASSRLFCRTTLRRP